MGSAMEGEIRTRKPIRGVLEFIRGTNAAGRTWVRMRIGDEPFLFPVGVIQEDSRGRCIVQTMNNELQAEYDDFDDAVKGFMTRFGAE